MTPQGGGMTSGQMAGLGGVALLGGGILDYIGQSQGAKATEREAKRQAAEQSAMLQARHDAYMRAIARQDPRSGALLAGQQTAGRMRAAAPALAAGGKALGLGSGQVASVGASLLPQQRLAGQQAGAAIDASRTAENVGRMSNEQGDIDSAMQGASALYPARSAIAQNKGAMLRTGGAMLQGAGMPLLTMAMNQAATEAPQDVRWGDPTAPQDGGGFTQVAIDPLEAVAAQPGGALYNALPPSPARIPIESYDMQRGAGMFRAVPRRPLRPTRY